MPLIFTQSLFIITIHLLPSSDNDQFTLCFYYFHTKSKIRKHVSKCFKPYNLKRIVMYDNYKWRKHVYLNNFKFDTHQVYSVHKISIKFPLFSLIITLKYMMLVIGTFKRVEDMLKIDLCKIYVFLSRSRPFVQTCTRGVVQVVCLLKATPTPGRTVAP